MKISNLRKSLAGLAIAGLVWPMSTTLAQETSATNSVQAAINAATASGPQLSHGSQQILMLAQAKVSDDTIIAFIKNSSLRYGLNASQIIYLRQQGISDAVITVMLNQTSQVASAPVPSTTTTTPAPQTTSVPMPTTPAPAPEPAVSTDYPQSAYVSPDAPPVTYMDPAPEPVYNNDQPYYDPYSYPVYGYYPPVSVLVIGGGFHGSGGFHGGGNHGGGFHGGGAGGTHGGGGGFHH